MTTQTAQHRTRAVLAQKTSDSVVITLNQTEYQLHLSTLNEVGTNPGDRIVGTIRMHAAKRFDIVNTGGGYIEPLYGQPRRIQGHILETDPTNNTITVHAATPIVLTLAPGQKASDFSVGQFVAGGVKSGSSFSPAQA